MNQAEQDELSLPIATIRVILSLAIMATGFLLTVALVGEFENLERLIAVGFLTIAFRQILGFVFLIQLNLKFTSPSIHELEHKGNG